MLDTPNLKLAYNAVHTDEISGTRLDESVARILRKQQPIGLTTAPHVDENQISQRVGKAKHLCIAQRSTDRMPTLIANQTRTLPARVKQHKVLVVGRSVATPALSNALRAQGAIVTSFNTVADPPGTEAISLWLWPAFSLREGISMNRRAMIDAPCPRG